MNKVNFLSLIPTGYPNRLSFSAPHSRVGLTRQAQTNGRLALPFCPPTLRSWAKRLAMCWRQELIGCTWTSWMAASCPTSPLVLAWCLPSGLRWQGESVQKGGWSGAVHTGEHEDHEVTRSTRDFPPKNPANLDSEVPPRKAHPDAVLDCHLMIVEPEQRVEDFAKAGADIISVHCEAGCSPWFWLQWNSQIPPSLVCRRITVRLPWWC